MGIFKLRRLYSESKSEEKKEEEQPKRHKIALKHVSSHRGLGRSVAAGGALTLGASQVGLKKAANGKYVNKAEHGKLWGAATGIAAGALSKRYANKLDKEGKSDKEIVRGATGYGAAVGGTAGAGIGALRGAMKAKGNWKTKAVAGAISGATSGTVGAAVGALGANKNARARVKERKEIEGEVEN